MNHFVVKFPFRHARFFVITSLLSTESGGVFFELLFEPLGIHFAVDVVGVIDHRLEKGDAGIDAFDLKRSQGLLRAGDGLCAILAMHDQFTQ